MRTPWGTVSTDNFVESDVTKRCACSPVQIKVGTGRTTHCNFFQVYKLPGPVANSTSYTVTMYALPTCTPQFFNTLFSNIGERNWSLKSLENKHLKCQCISANTCVQIQLFLLKIFTWTESCGKPLKSGIIGRLLCEPTVSWWCMLFSPFLSLQTEIALYYKNSGAP